MRLPISRQQLFKGIIGAGGVLAGGLGFSAAAEQHPTHPVAPPDAVGMFYDNTKCTGTLRGLSAFATGFLTSELS
jgi:hypothetical protein